MILSGITKYMSYCDIQKLTLTFEKKICNLYCYMYVDIVISSLYIRTAWYLKRKLY